MPDSIKRIPLLIALLALLAPCANAVAAPSVKNPNGRFLGIVKHKGQGGAPPGANEFNTAPSVPGINHSGNLEYHNGAVMHTNTTHVIFWQPSGFLFGSSVSASDTYKSLVGQYFTDVASDSGTHLNVYASDPQYSDGSGAAAYDSTYGGAILDTGAFPASGCNAGTTCITDAQMQAEIQKVIKANSLPHGRGDMYFLYFPQNAVNCETSSNSSCSTNVYCAYHSYISAGTANEVIYANMPFPATGCDNGSHPNGSVADEVLSVTSHEHNEAITDPDDVSSGNTTLSGWWDNSTGNEDGDNCNFTFGPALGTAGNGQSYNQLINGHDYYLQLEWSNSHTACVGRYPDPTAAMTVTPSSPSADQSTTFSGTGSTDLGGTIATYAWDFGDGSTGSGSSTTHTYTSAGTYTAKLTVSDSTGVTASTSKSVTVTPVNHAPTCSAASATGYAGTSFPVTLSCSDQDAGDTITLATVSGPSHGSLGTINQSTGNVTYTPSAGYNGSDSFTFKATDNHGAASGSATASITVNANAVPSCSNTSKVVVKGSSISVPLVCSDADSGDSVTLSVVSGPSHGSLGTIDQVGQTVTYTPTATYTGPDSFTFKGTDNHGAPSTNATASLTVDTPPSCSDGSVTAPPGTSTAATLSCSDADSGDTITRSIVSGPSHGSLGSINQTTGAVNYTPTSGYTGADSFTFKATDSHGLTSTTRTESVLVDSAPSCSATSKLVAAGSSVVVPLACSDPDSGDTITRSIVTQPSHGVLATIDQNAGSVLYTPTSGFAGSDSFTFKATDGGNLSSAAATASLTVDTTPSCSDGSATVPPSTTTAVTLVCSDPDSGDAITRAVVSGPSHGTLGSINQSTGAVNYTPTAGFTGTDSATFKATDSHGLVSATKTETIHVDHPPACSDGTITVDAAATIAVPLTCTDADSGDILTRSIVTPPAHGSLGAIAGGTVQYTADQNFGPDQFTFKANDGQVDSPAATIAITVNGPLRTSPPAGGGGGSGGSGGSGGTGPSPGGSTIPGGQPPNVFAAVSPPHLTRLSVSPHTVHAHRGAVLRWTLDLPATTTFRVQRAVPGRSVGGSCVKPSRVNTAARRCTRLVTQGRLLRRTAAAGSHSLRLKTSSLAPGSYRLTAIATDSAGRSGRVVHASFNVVS